MSESGSSNDKMLYYYSPPPDDKKLSEFDSKLLGIIKECGVASVNDLLTRLKPDYKDTKGKNRWQAIKHTWSIIILMSKIMKSTKYLAEIHCIRVNR